MEDVALYSESVLYHLLTIVFPTMRLWSSSTTSTAIQWLYEMNRFFGLQGEALYYQPLVARILDLEFKGSVNDNLNSIEFSNSRSTANLVLTGHSLGIQVTDSIDYLLFVMIFIFIYCCSRWWISSNCWNNDRCSVGFVFAAWPRNEL